ncbi:MAG: hypothetical protein IPJ74_22050 [Saprospiraceae bacterium]|nr:hypothetical protein [Saprospiraceae bacterium]
MLLAVVLGVTVNAASPYHDKEFKTSETPALVTVVDTLPQKGTMNFTGRHNGQDVKTTVKNGKITYLKIDGKEIAETEYKDYEPLVEEIMENVPPPPPPPPAPMPPAPVRPGTPPPPPAPPAPKGGIYYSDDAALKELALVEVQMKRELEAQLVELKMQEAELREHLNKESSEEMKHRKELLEEEMKHLKEMADQARAEHEVALVEHKHEMVRHQEELKKMRAELELMEAKNKELKNRFGKELLNDGLIKSSDNYRINLSGKSMEVNGKAVSSSIADKYRKIFEEVTGGALCSDCQFTFGKGKEE